MVVKRIVAVTAVTGTIQEVVKFIADEMEDYKPDGLQLKVETHTVSVGGMVRYSVELSGERKES